MGMRRTLSHIRTAIGAPSHEVLAVLSRPARAGVYLARLGLRIIKQWVRDRCPQQAAALTYQTTLAMVPLLALVFAILRQTHNLEAQSRLVEFLSTQVLPDMGDVVAELASFSEKVATGAAGGLGLGFTLATCYFLYDTVENTFNDIWHVTTRRSWFRKFLIFYPVVTLLPVLAGAYLYWSGRLIVSGHLARFFGPLSIQFGALFLINWMLPNIRVRWHAALAGTLVTGFALEGLKWGFVHFAKGMLLTNYSGVYGPLAALIKDLEEARQARIGAITIAELTPKQNVIPCWRRGCAHEEEFRRTGRTPAGTQRPSGHRLSRSGPGRCSRPQKPACAEPH
jgi:YihY family inner membrane protein